MPRKPAKPKTALNAPNFAALVEAVRRVHEQSAAAASRAVNVSLTLRNWLIGWHICEYEQNGDDRATYGERLLDRLAEALQEKGITRVDVRELRRFRRFYLVYPQIRESLTPEWYTLLPLPVGVAHQKRETVSPEFGADGKTLITRLSFSHLAELIEIEDPFKRAFYEVECISGNWSVRALKRQIATLHFERSGLSTNKEKLATLADDAYIVHRAHGGKTDQIVRKLNEWRVPIL